MAVITTGELDDLIAFGESSHEPEAGHRRLRPAIHHPDFFDCRHPCADEFGHFHFKRIGNTEANALLRRLADSANDNWRSMSENSRSPASDVIDQFNTIDGPDASAFRALDEKWFASNRPEGPDRGIHAAWNLPDGAREEVA